MTARAGCGPSTVQRYNSAGVALGAAFQVSPAGSSISGGYFAGDASGQTVFVWSVAVWNGSTTLYTTYALRDSAQGQPIDAAPLILLGSSTLRVCGVGMSPAGGLVAAYYGSSDATNQTTEVVAQAYSSIGSAAGSQITVASWATSSGKQLTGESLSMASDGSFVVGWSSYLATTGYQIQALRYTRPVRESTRGHCKSWPRRPAGLAR